MIYSEAERKEIERVYGVFKDYIHASKFLDFVWSEKLGYLLLHIDPTKNTIEEDQIITSADELCAELFNEVATDVFQEAKREHFYPDADDDEIAEIRRRFQSDGTGLLSQEYIDPQVVTSPQDAFYADKCSLPLRETEGKVCSEFVMCYPPGIPILAPGELITQEIIDYIIYAKEKGCSMQGMEDPKVEHLQVLKGGI